MQKSSCMLKVQAFYNLKVSHCYHWMDLPNQLILAKTPERNIRAFFSMPIFQFLFFSMPKFRYLCLNKGFPIYFVITKKPRETWALWLIFLFSLGNVSYEQSSFMMVYVFSFVTTKLQQYGLKIVHAKYEEHMVIFEFSSNLQRGSNALCRHKTDI